MFFFIQITKPRGAAIQPLLQLSGRLQLVMAQVFNFASSLMHYYLMNLLVFKFTFILFLQIDRASLNKTQISAHDSRINESEDEDEEVDEILYGEEDDESELSSDDNS